MQTLNMIEFAHHVALHEPVALSTRPNGPLCFTLITHDDYCVGHLHVDGSLHCHVSKRLRKQLIIEGYAYPHPLLPHSRWVALDACRVCGPEAQWLIGLAVTYAIAVTSPQRWADAIVAERLRQLDASPAIWYALTRRLPPD